MIPNNNFSVLPWYTSIERQNARKWWLYGRQYPLFTPAGFLLPFQILRRQTSDNTLSYFYIYKADGTFYGDFTQNIASALSVKSFGWLDYNVIIFGGQTPIFSDMPNGQYYGRMNFGGVTYYSEVFTVVNDIGPYLKIEWWDSEDFIMDAGVIAYKYAGSTQFKNRIYLCAEIAKPEYIFEEEGVNRDGYFFPEKMISGKKYKFNFFASEYILDVMRFVRMSDYVEITSANQKYSVDTFLLSPTWEAEGDVAAVEAEFTAATVAKRIGVGYIKALRGDFNDDFNNDFNNQ